MRKRNKTFHGDIEANLKCGNFIQVAKALHSVLSLSAVRNLNAKSEDPSLHYIETLMRCHYRAFQQLLGS